MASPARFREVYGLHRPLISRAMVLCDHNEIPVFSRHLKVPAKILHHFLQKECHCNAMIALPAASSAVLASARNVQSKCKLLVR